MTMSQLSDKKSEVICLNNLLVVCKQSEHINYTNSEISFTLSMHWVTPTIILPPKTFPFLLMALFACSLFWNCMWIQFPSTGVWNNNSLRSITTKTSTAKVSTNWIYKLLGTWTYQKFKQGRNPLPQGTIFHIHHDDLNMLAWSSIV